MKKVFLMLAAAMLTASAFAQKTAITSNKAGDNWYVGINAGVASTPNDKGDALEFRGFAPNLGLRIGKNFTTVFGLAAEATAFFESNKNKSVLYNKTIVDALNANLLATFNLSNAFAGYKGEPRFFEVIALGGFGYGHKFASHKLNELTSKFALDFAFNFGSAKQFQAYVEPSITYGLKNWYTGSNTYLVSAGNDMKYDFAKANLQLNVGVNYKFGNSNGSHNFKAEQLRDQAEIDQLNAKINELRGEVSSKDSKIAADGRTISDLQAQLAACQAKPTAAVQVVEKKNTQLQPIVIFGQGKSTIDAAQYASIEMVAKYMRNHKDAKILVKGYASPEGNAELNQKLSEARAAAVKTALVKRYKIAADRITTEGLGATKDISEENDFNRVAMFFDTTAE